MRRLVVLLCLVAPLVAGAADLRNDHFDLSLAAGAALPGKVEASWYDDFDPDYSGWFTSMVSPVARTAFTWWPAPRLARVGPTLSVHYALLLLPEPYNAGFWDGRDHWIPDDGIHFLQVEGGVRFRFPLAESLTVDPALSLGYCHTFSSSVDARDSGLTLNLAADLRWWRRGWQPLVSLGLMAQLYGGVKDILYVRSYPFAYALIGAGF